MNVVRFARTHELRRFKVRENFPTAAFRRETVFVADIQADPLWADYKHLALPYGLRACWSTPIFDAQRNVLGTFAMYYRQPGMPNERHLRLIDMVTQTAAVCIAKHRSEEALRESEERYRTVPRSRGLIPDPDCDAPWSSTCGISSSRITACPLSAGPKRLP